MLADRLEHYASTAMATAPGSSQWGASALAGLAAPLRSALKLAGTTSFTRALEAQALGDVSHLHACLCMAHLPHPLIWVELPAEEKERVREALLAARGQPLAAPDPAAASALTLGLLLAWEGGMRQVSVSLVVEVICPTNGPGLVFSPCELLLALPLAAPTGAAEDVDACLDDLEGRMALRPSQWCDNSVAELAMGDNWELQSEALSIWSLVAMLGTDGAHRIRPKGPADGVVRSAADFMILDLCENAG